MTWQGKWRGSEGVKQGGDYVFNQESQCTTDIFTTAALFMNDRIHDFFSIGRLKQFKHKTIIILNKSHLLLFPCVHKTDYIMHVCLGGDAHRFGNRVPTE